MYLWGIEQEIRCPICHTPHCVLDSWLIPSYSDLDMGKIGFIIKCLSKKCKVNYFVLYKGDLVRGKTPTESLVHVEYYKTLEQKRKHLRR